MNNISALAVVWSAGARSVLAVSVARCLQGLVLMAGVLLGFPAQAAQQQAGLCSETKIQIAQELALERVGFLATLEVTNNEGDAAITGFSASLIFEDTVAQADGSYVDKSGQFFVQPPVLSGINDINGGGIIPAGQRARVEWFIIPKVSAGGTTPVGIQYRVGAILGGSLNGVELSPTDLVVLPDTITVKPDPQLDITYFQPRDVDGDNPFTMGIVESPIPFTLGVLVKNVGYGPARKVTIASDQPRIVENTQDLLIVPQLIGSRVDDDPTDFTSLTVSLGDIQPNQCRKAAWDMITSLSGEFVSFKASYTHSPELGGRDTSVIVGLDAFFMVHEVKNDLPGRDGLTDFLAQVEPPAAIPGLNIEPKIIPDTMFETDCNEVPINVLRHVTLGSFDGTTAQVHVNADIEGWVWFALDDPAQAQLPIRQIRRSDGKLLDPHNAWTTVRYRFPDNQKLMYLSVLDYVQLGQYTYSVEYLPIGSDTLDPVTTLLFSGPSEQDGDTAYVVPETQMLFIVRDDSPVGTFMRLDNEADFSPAYPFTIDEPGTHTLQFYSRDTRGNSEDVQTRTIIVSEDGPLVADLTVDNEELLYSGQALSVRPDDATISFGATGTGTLGAVVEVFAGAYAWPTLTGVPSSPTRSADASMVVGGDNVDFYRYRINNGGWSAERASSLPLVLTGQSGTVRLDVEARSAHGDWPPESEALSQEWTVSPGAPLTTIVPAMATPSRQGHPTFTVSGVELYRWTYNDGYFRAEAPVSEPFTLPRVDEGTHEIGAIGKVGSVWQPEESPVTYHHVFDTEWGLRFPGGARVRTNGLGDVTSGMSWTWDGRDDDGDPVVAGWYTIKLSVTDALGRTSAAVALVRVGDLLAQTAAVAPGPAGQDYPDAAGDWVVWQDQLQGTWDIRARRVGEDTVSTLTGNGRNHERPRTDGYVVVWQSRAEDGHWEVWGSLLGSAAVAAVLSADPTMDQTRPTVDWPWAVWQERPLDDPSAPDQLVAYDFRDGTVQIVDPSTQPQLDPDVDGGLVVWQDFRDVGFGEIYLKDLFTGQVQRITQDPGGQYHPAVEGPWVVWADNRDGDFDVHGYNLLAPGDQALTSTPENETRPSLNGGWVAFTEDSGGLTVQNVRAVHLGTRATVQLTSSATGKERARLAQRRLYWLERVDGVGEVRAGVLPDLQPVAANTNLVAITSGLAAHVAGGRDLLSLWHEQAGVTEIRRYTSLVPTPVSQAVAWGPNGAQGPNFALQEGGFLWVKFGAAAVLDFDASACGTQSFAVGNNVFGHSCFPDGYTAYRLIRSVGTANVNAVRALDQATGRWAMASVVDGRLQGEDFDIAPVSVVMLDLAQGVEGWRP